MATGGRLAPKHKTRNKVQLKSKSSDGSDEDYMFDEDEDFDESEDEYCSSLADDETEEILGEFEEFEEHVEKKIKKVGRPRGRKSSQRRTGAVKSRKKNAAYSEEEREDFNDDDFAGTEGRKQGMPSHDTREDNYSRALCREQGEEDFGKENLRNKTWVPSTQKNIDHCNEKPRKKTEVSYREENEDSDCDDSGEDEDEEFTPDEVDAVDDDEDLLATKKNKVDRLRMQEAQTAKGKKRKSNFKALKRAKRKKSIKKQVLRRKNREKGKEFRDEVHAHVAQEKKRTQNGRGRRKLDASSDSDFVTSELPGYEYTISEEEREQIREASEFCGRSTSSLRSSLKMLKEEEIVPSQRKRAGKKDKEKMVDTKIEIGKPICGICLSEEGKRTVRGVLNCCSHYFCFACIMEWSKVESRCPLCKQRFATISRTAQVDGGHDIGDVVIPVPKRDQVYQPSEEELRGYLDPYEHVLCTECHQGGDDALMLLCDICDSPAHTYCVGLGPEVPEGNWYCDSCRPAVLASSNAQALNPTSSEGTNNNLSVGSSPVGTVRETFDLNELYLPETPSSQVTGHSPSPRYSVGDSQPASPASGSGAFTLYDRRRIQRQIHLLLNDRSRQSERSLLSGISLFGSQIYRDRAASLQGVPVQVAPQNICDQRRLPNCTMPSLYGREVLSPRSIGLRGQVAHNRASTSKDQSSSGLSHAEFSGTTGRIGHGLGPQQLRPCNSISNTGANVSISPYQFKEFGHSSPQKEHVQSMVRSHLKSLSRNLDLDYISFKCIARTSTHTILAAVGLEHRWNEVYPVQTRPLICDHLNNIASQQTCPVAGQCSSCFDWFIRNVVGEIMSSRAPLLSKD